jgi:hypothetical protein
MMGRMENHPTTSRLSNGPRALTTKCPMAVEGAWSSVVPFVTLCSCPKNVRCPEGLTPVPGMAPPHPYGTPGGGHHVHFPPTSFPPSAPNLPMVANTRPATTNFADTVRKYRVPGDLQGSPDHGGGHLGWTLSGRHLDPWLDLT